MFNFIFKFSEPRFHNRSFDHDRSIVVFKNNDCTIRRILIAQNV